MKLFRVYVAYDKYDDDFQHVNFIYIFTKIHFKIYFEDYLMTKPTLG